MTGINNKSDVLVSVVILCYNQEDTIKQTLDSIAEQKVDYNFEILIGDDFWFIGGDYLQETVKLGLVKSSKDETYNELQQTRTRLADRQVIDKAKALLIQHRQMDEDEAYHAMRKLAMDRSQKLVDVANDIVSVLGLLAPKSQRTRDQ